MKPSIYACDIHDACMYMYAPTVGSVIHIPELHDQPVGVVRGIPLNLLDAFLLCVYKN